MKRALAKRLAALDGFADPDVELEQYPTSPELAANVVHLADLHGDLSGVVVDLGAGTGVLALAVATRTPERVVGIERDRAALGTARTNETTLGAERGVDWIQADARRPPIACTDATVVMNPPFGAQYGNRGADRGFLDAARSIAVVSYSIHNAGSREFVESYAADHDGAVTHAFAAELPIEGRFEFHTSDSADVPVEVYRIEWSGYSSAD